MLRDRSPGDAPYQAMLVAPAVATAALAEEVVAGRRGLHAAAAVLLALYPAFLVVAFHAELIVAGTPPAVVGWDLPRTLLELLPLAVPLVIVVLVRRRGGGALSVSVALATLTPLVVLAIVTAVGALGDRQLLSLASRDRDLVADLVMALPLAVLAGDLVGPGPHVEETPGPVAPGR